MVGLKLRNIGKVTFRLHRIDLQAYFRKMHGQRVEAGRLTDPADKTWEFAGRLRQKSRSSRRSRSHSAGAARMLDSGDDEWESRSVLRSDLEVIVKSSREVLAFVQNMLSAKPPPESISSSATARRWRPPADGDDGVFGLDRVAGTWLCASVLGNGHAASYGPTWRPAKSSV